MTTEQQIQKIEEFVDHVLATETEYFKVLVKIKPTNNIKVFIDGDNGLPIEKCVSFNRQIYHLLEDAAIYPEGDFSLEVSSPGVGEPLYMHRQYLRNVGRAVEVTFIDGEKKEGKLLQVAEADIIIEQTTGKGKKAETQQVVIPFDNIKTTIVQIQF